MARARGGGAGWRLSGAVPASLAVSLLCACSLDFDGLVMEAPGADAAVGDSGAMVDGGTTDAGVTADGGTMDAGDADAGTGADGGGGDSDAGDAATDTMDAASDADAALDAGSGCTPLADDQQFTRVATGADVSCAIRDQQVICFGRNSSGQRGVGDSMSDSAVMAVPGLSDAVEVAAGRYHVCARRATGAVLCWGQSWDGQLGHADDSTLPGVVVEVPDASDIAAGDYHSCAVRADRTVYCWGDNGDGQIGVVDTNDQSPVQVPSLTDVVQVEAGGAHTCALDASGAVYCWGYNGDGQLGDNSTDDSVTPVRVVTLGGGDLRDIQAIASGDDHVCALTSGGVVYCWGENDYGQLGDGTDVSSDVARAVGGLDGLVIEAIAAGEEHTCAIDSDGHGYCWGQNRSGQLGDGSQQQRLVPTPIAGGLDLATITAGGDSAASHTCAVDVCGRLHCWGARGYGQLGDDTFPFSSAPARVTDSADGVWLGGNHTCFTRSGALYCFGQNDDGQLGDGTRLHRSSPGSTPVLEDVEDVALGLGFTCATQVDGDLYCWGRNDYDQLAVGDSRDRIAAPTLVLGGSWAAASAGEHHGCALDDSGGTHCWGRNQLGQLGVPGDPDAATPTALDLSGLGISSSDEIASDEDFTCVRSGASVACWGDDGEGQLGQGAPSSGAPAIVTGLSASAIAAGYDHACAITTGGQLSCWGHNDRGQLGDGSTTDRATHGLVGSLVEVALVEAGDRFTCGSSSSGFFCFGHNEYAQLGRGAVTGREVSPAAGPALSNVDALGAGDSHVCAVGRLNGDDGLYCWGRSAYGQLGDGVAVEVTEPREVSGL